MRESERARKSESESGSDSDLDVNEIFDSASLQSAASVSTVSHGQMRVSLRHMKYKTRAQLVIKTGGIVKDLQSALQANWNLMFPENVQTYRLTCGGRALRDSSMPLQQAGVCDGCTVLIAPAPSSSRARRTRNWKARAEEATYTHQEEACRQSRSSSSSSLSKIRIAQFRLHQQQQQEQGQQQLQLCALKCAQEGDLSGLLHAISAERVVVNWQYPDRWGASLLHIACTAG